MGIWLDILQLGAAGKASRALDKLTLEIPLTLREIGPFSEGAHFYRGALPKAVRHFASGLPPSERPLFQTYESDLVDRILDDVMAEVERTLFLVELCRAHPEITMADLVALFPWARGLNRSEQWKHSRIVRYLKSMIACGVLPPEITAANLEEVNEPLFEPLFEFDEIKYAVSHTRLERSWKDFKEDHDHGSEFLCIDDSGDISDVHAEGADYGSIRMIDVVMNMAGQDDEFELKMDLRMLGESLGPELTLLMEQMHIARPTDGYRPIAWHNVFWRVSDDYEWLALLLEMKEPHQETDQALANYLAASYTDVKGVSRPSIHRRRKSLDEACDRTIVSLLRERFATSPWKATLTA
ncbi:MAG: hypothetical protein MOB07_08025 [Acidobacteria bacterium]|nr:hypothetical protein [Acidobacteriota bacterium]